MPSAATMPWRSSAVSQRTQCLPACKSLSVCRKRRLQHQQLQYQGEALISAMVSYSALGSNCGQKRSSCSEQHEKQPAPWHMTPLRTSEICKIFEQRAVRLGQHELRSIQSYHSHGELDVHHSRSGPQESHGAPRSPPECRNLNKVRNRPSCYEYQQQRPRL